MDSLTDEKIAQQKNRQRRKKSILSDTTFNHDSTASARCKQNKKRAVFGTNVGTY
jgi:hypothetical protein